MDLNELYSRHQIALISMISGTSSTSRTRGEECANFYADRIDALRDRIGSDRTVINHADLKRILRG